MTTPYYQDDLVTIYHGDAADTDDLDWDVVVTDPPYPKPGERHVLADRLRSLVIVSDSVAVFGYAEDLVRLCIAADESPDDWITWWPTNAEMRRWGPPGQTPREAEHIAVFGEVRWIHGAPSTPNADKIASTSLPMTAGARGDVRRSPLGKKWGDVWTDPSPGIGFQWRQRHHPNEKPLGIMQRLIQMVASGTVLDPYCGSGTTLLAAKSLGRKAVGVEQVEAYCEIAAIRCSQEVLGLVG